MKFVLEKTLPGFRPLYCRTRDLILGKGNRLYRASFDLNDIELLCTLPLGLDLIAATGSRLMERIFRRGIQTAALLDENTLLAVTRGRIWRVNLNTGEVTLDFEIPDGRRLLALTVIKDSAGRNSVCFGEYFSNDKMVPVRVWRRSDGLQPDWHVAASFGQGEINHVHSIYQDGCAGSVYLLTGDFQNGAGIWKTSTKFDTLRPIVRGNQQYRACWLWPLDDGKVVYATDSQFTPNAVYKLDLNSATATPVCGIEGSSIYAGAARGHAVFSSTVEPGDVGKTLLATILDQKRGPGILSDNAIIYTVDAQGEVTEQFRAHKDAYPPRLAQFATFSFPGGVLPDGLFWAYGMAVRGYDGACLLFKVAS